MFLIAWTEEAFDQMQQLVLDHPDLRSEFALALRTIATQLHRAADVWGESRAGSQRLGFAAPLAVFFEVDVEHTTAEVQGVRLYPDDRT